MKQASFTFFRGILLAGIISVFSMQVIAQEDFETLYNMLNAKIQSEEPEPRFPNNKSVEAYLDWMRIKAADRDNARAISLRANREGNPYWERKFLDLALDAQWSGDVTVWQGAILLMRTEDKFGDIGYARACYVAGPRVGQRLYNGAVQYGFSTDDIVARAQCLMRYALKDLEGKWLYADNYAFPGSFDSEGNQVLPPGDNWNSDCMRRGEFTTITQGDPLPYAEMAMEMVQKVRDVCPFYHLDPEYNDATDLMVQYLKEKQVLCVKPPNEGHKWYIKLAEKYNLSQAKEYMDGYYAIINGKVEKDEDGIRKPVAGAEVQFEAEKDQQVWTTKTDAAGNYRIEGVLLHKNCSPFTLTAKGDGCYKLENIPGPLDEPDTKYELEKNLLLECGVQGYYGWFTITKSWDYTDSYKITYVGSKTVTCKGIFKLIEEMKGQKYQPIHIYGPTDAKVTWKHKEERFCGGDCQCPGKFYDEFGAGSSIVDMWQNLMITTFAFPLEIKEVASRFDEIGMENYYDISFALTDNQGIIQTRTKNGDPCQWETKPSTESIPSADLRYSLKDVNKLKGHTSWQSSHTHISSGISITDMPDFQSGQKPFMPQKDGTEITFTVSWDFTAF